MPSYTKKKGKTMITQNCIIDNMPEDEYHNDPTPAVDGFIDSASLSSSTATDILEKTEIEARMRIRRLNPPEIHGESDSDAVNLGTMCHDYILKGGRGTFEIARFDSWRTNDAKAAKADIISRGLIPLNTTTADRILPAMEEMGKRLREQLAEHKEFPDIMRKGRPEQSGFAFDGQIWNRARFDWLDESIPDLIVDYKTTGLDFDGWERELWKEKYLQCPHYERTLNLINGRDTARFIYVVQRTVEPYLVKVIVQDKSFADEIKMRYETARQRFMHCTKTGIWRGEPPYTKHSCPPPWILAKWEMDRLDTQNEQSDRVAQSDESLKYALSA
jgi:hypothetical protein